MKCAAPGCKTQTKARHLMCFPHWCEVPESTRSEITKHYRPGQTATTASPEYMRALANAIRSVR